LSKGEFAVAKKKKKWGKHYGGIIGSKL